MHLLRSVPNLDPANPRALETRLLLAQHSLILHTQQAPPVPALQPEHLSLKAAFGGNAVYRIGPRRAAAHDQAYLVVNAGRAHTLEPAPATNAEILSLFFHGSLVQQTLDATHRPRAFEAGILPARREGLDFVETPQPHDRLVSPRVFALREALLSGGVSRSWAEEQMVEILFGLLRRDRELMAAAEKIPRLRPGTREEIFRRLQRAREFIEASYGEIRSIAEVARTACMSYAHFHRLFTNFYGVTPHRFLTERRLAVALGELRRERFTITELSYEVGFENVNSFGALFRRRFGLAPSSYREGTSIAEARLRAPRGRQPRLVHPAPDLALAADVH